MDDAVNPRGVPAAAAPPRDPVRASAALLRRWQHPSGAWPAAPGFAPYRFCWFRDGAFVADGASAAGDGAAADAFHDWCAAVLRREAAAVAVVERAAARGEILPDDGYLPARYDLLGHRHADDWWTFQIDGYGTWLWALRRHLRRAGANAAPAERWAGAVTIATRYLLATAHATCRDWWEEHRHHRHVATLSGVVAGLRAAVDLGMLDAAVADRAQALIATLRADLDEGGTAPGGHLRSWLREPGGDPPDRLTGKRGSDVDASLLAVAAWYDVLALDDPRVAATVDAVERTLTSGPGTSGVHRYAADTFYGGGQWPVLACMLAGHHARAGAADRARDLLAWVRDRADAEGHLPEQAGPWLAPDRRAEWERRWGPPAHPLVWSHGMLLSASEMVAAAT